MSYLHWAPIIFLNHLNNVLRSGLARLFWGALKELGRPFDTICRLDDLIGDINAPKVIHPLFGPIGH